MPCSLLRIGFPVPFHCFFSFSFISGSLLRLNGFVDLLEVNFSSKFPESYANQQTPEEGQTTQWPKCFDNNRKDEEISTNANNINTSTILERIIKTSLWSMNFLEDFMAGPGLERAKI